MWPGLLACVLLLACAAGGVMAQAGDGEPGLGIRPEPLVGGISAHPDAGDPHAHRAAVHGVAELNRDAGLRGMLGAGVDSVELVAVKSVRSQVR